MNYEFTEKTEQTIAAAIQLAKEYANAQGKDPRIASLKRYTDSSLSTVHPPHLASVMLNETSSGEANGALPAGRQSQSLFASAISKAGGDPAVVNRAIQKLVVRLPAQDPPPEDISLSQATHRVLREAQNLQKTMVCTARHLFALLHYKKRSLKHLISTTRISPKTICS